MQKNAKRAVRFLGKGVAVGAFVWGAAWLTGCCCCGTGVPETGGEFVVRAEGRSTLPNLDELEDPPAPEQLAQNY